MADIRDIPKENIHIVRMLDLQLGRLDLGMNRLSDEDLQKFVDRIKSRDFLIEGQVVFVELKNSGTLVNHIPAVVIEVKRVKDYEFTYLLNLISGDVNDPNNIRVMITDNVKMSDSINTDVGVVTTDMIKDNKLGEESLRGMLNALAIPGIYTLNTDDTYSVHV